MVELLSVSDKLAARMIAVLFFWQVQPKLDMGFISIIDGNSESQSLQNVVYATRWMWLVDSADFLYTFHMPRLETLEGSNLRSVLR